VKFILVDSAYSGVLSELNSFRVPNSLDSFQSLTESFLNKAFGAFPAYKSSLAKLGHSPILITPNHMVAQLCWAKENNVKVRLPLTFFFKRWELFSRVPLFGHILQGRLPVGRILERQITELEPDIVLIGDLSLLSARQVRRLRASTSALMVGQIASPLPSKRHFEGYDLIVSAHPGIVTRLNRDGVRAVHLPLAFGMPSTAPKPKSFSSRRSVAAFVGSFGRHHRQNYPLLRAISEATENLEIYGNPSLRKLEKFGLTRYYKGQAFGSEMFKVFGEVALGINRHAKFADGYAVNMRMYEVAGSGAVLLTEDAPNLEDVFPLGSVVTYESSSDAAVKVANLLKDMNAAKSVAAFGQEQVLSRHSYDQRVQELLRIIEKLDINRHSPS
jgi:hypothetical protein